MVSIVVYDSHFWKNDNPDYPSDKMYKFSRVWNINEDGSFGENIKNVSMRAKNESVKVFGKLEKGGIYLVKHRGIEDGILKYTEFLDKADFIWYLNGKYTINEGKCKGVVLNDDYFNKEYDVNKFLIDKNPSEVKEFTKHMLLCASLKGVSSSGGVETLGLENRISYLMDFDKDLYIQNQVDKHKIAQKKKVVEPSLSFAGVQSEIDFTNPVYGVKHKPKKPSNVSNTVVEKRGFRKFTKSDVKYIIDNRHILNSVEIGEYLDKKPKSIIDKIYSLIKSGEISDRGCVSHSKNKVSDAMKIKVAKALKHFRKERGLYQYEVSEIIGVDNSHISRLEKYGDKMTDRMYHKLKYLINNYDEMGDVISGEKKKTIEVPSKIISEEAVETKPVEDVIEDVVLNKTSTRWSVSEFEYLKENYKIHGAEYCSEQLGRSILAIYKKAGKLGLTKVSVSVPPATIVEKEVVPIKKEGSKKLDKTEIINSEKISQLEESNKILSEANRIATESNKTLQEALNTVLNNQNEVKPSFWKRVFGGK